MRAKYQKALQQGFVLATVLVILLIISLMVSALLSNQMLATRTFSDVLNHSKIEQISHNLHRTCLKHIYNQLTEHTLSQNNDINLTKNISLADGSCQVLIKNDAVTASNQYAWTPRLRVISKSNSSLRSEISDWRYPNCLNNSIFNNCFTAPKANLTLISQQNTTHTISVQYLRNASIQTSWRRQ